MFDPISDEKIGIKKIKLVKSEIGTIAVVGSFANADNFLMAWCSSSRGWLRCEFEIEYLDEHILKGEYKTFRRKDGRVSLSHHIRSTLGKILRNIDSVENPEAVFDNIGIQFRMGTENCKVCLDFLDRYETEDFSRLDEQANRRRTKPIPAHSGRQYGS